MTKVYYPGGVLNAITVGHRVDYHQLCSDTRMSEDQKICRTARQCSVYSLHIPPWHYIAQHKKVSQIVSASIASVRYLFVREAELYIY